MNTYGDIILLVPSVYPSNLKLIKKYFRTLYKLEIIYFTILLKPKFSSINFSKYIHVQEKDKIK